VARVTASPRRCAPRAGLPWAPPAMPPRCGRPRRRHPDRPLPLTTAGRPRRLHQPRRPPAAAARRHRFPRSHGPTEHKVNAPWLTFRCPKTRAPGSPPATACEVENAEETRDPQKSRRGRGHCRPEEPAGDAGSGLDPREATPSKQPKEPKSRRNPRQNPSRAPLARMFLLPTREPLMAPGGLPCLLANPASDGHAQPSRKNRRNPRPA
jgi:hypothetical protein